MGAQLVTLVLAKWKHLNDTAFRILVKMALTALDQEKDGKPAHLYFGGHEALARSLRRPFPEGDSEQARKARQNILRDVRRSVKDLAKQGAIEAVDTGKAVRQGETKTYRLTLWRVAGVQDPSSAGGDNPSSASESAGVDDPSSAGGDDPCRGGGEDPHEQGLTTPPRKEGGATEELREETRVAAGDQPQDARDTPESLRLVATDGIRDPFPAAPGVPGQRAMLLPVAVPQTGSEPSQSADDSDVPYGRCADCGRAFLRSRPACPHCGVVVGAS